jgi:hypothetical protein
LQQDPSHANAWQAAAAALLKPAAKPKAKKNPGKKKAKAKTAK